MHPQLPLAEIPIRGPIGIPPGGSNIQPSDEGLSPGIPVWARSSYRCEPQPDRSAELRKALVKLARQKPRFGYGRPHAVLNRRGHKVNVPTGLIWKSGGWSGARSASVWRANAPDEPPLTGANQERAMGFIVDCLTTATNRPSPRNLNSYLTKRRAERFRGTDLRQVRKRLYPAVPGCQHSRRAIRSRPHSGSG